MTTWQDLEDAQTDRQHLLESYVGWIASEPSLPVRLAMTNIWRTWTRWTRDLDYDDEVTTDWAGVLDYLAAIFPPTAQRARALTAEYATRLTNIDNELLKKELQR